ncbi:MAG: hypothetical protein QNK23_00475 [Crocinitomicaceae bacterium]|nr:hypothetical protein [Crocinitomicaceae bacterium]
MTEKNRGAFVGTWRWHKTVIKQTFAIGDPYFYDYTPANQGFEYYCNITTDGMFEDYENGELVHLFTLSEVDYESLGANSNSLVVNYNCSESNRIGLTHPSQNLTNDSINITEFPLNFYDEENNLETIRNYFVRE